MLASNFAHARSTSPAAIRRLPSSNSAFAAALVSEAFCAAASTGHNHSAVMTRWRFMGLLGRLNRERQADRVPGGRGREASDRAEVALPRAARPELACSA